MRNPRVRTRRNACSSWNLSHAGLEDRVMLSGTEFAERVFFDSAPIIFESLQPRDVNAALATIRHLSGGGGIPADSTSIGPTFEAAILASVESGGVAVQVAQGLTVSAQPFDASAGPSGLYGLLIQWNGSNQDPSPSVGDPLPPGLVSMSFQMTIQGPVGSGGLADLGAPGFAIGVQPVPAGPFAFGWGGAGQAAPDPIRWDRSPFDTPGIPPGPHELSVRWTALNADRGTSAGEPYPVVSMALQVMFQEPGDAGGFSARNPFQVAEIPGVLSTPSILAEGGTARGQWSILRNALRNEHDEGSIPAVGPSPPMQGISAEAGLRRLTPAGPTIGGEEGVGPEAPAILEASSPVEADSSGQSPVAVVESTFDLPAPIGSDLLLQAWSNNAASWDAALEELIGGVDEMITGLVDFEGDASYLPWAVGAGLALAASEAARKARPRPDPYLAYVDGSAVEPMPPT
jgi:hypothetical protein